MAVRIIRGMEDLVASGSQLVWSLAHQTLRRWYNRGLMPCRRFLEAWLRIGKCYQVWQRWPVGAWMNQLQRTGFIYCFLDSMCDELLVARRISLIKFLCLILPVILFQLSGGWSESVLFLIWLISVCLCLFVWLWGGAGCLLESYKACFLTRVSLPAHMAVIRKQHDQLFDLTVWLKSSTFKVVFEMHCCRTT